MKWSSNRRGFTLLELMMVMVVISILAAILAKPIRNHYKALRETRADVMAQGLTAALEQYRSINGRYPPGWMVNSTQQIIYNSQRNVESTIHWMHGTNDNTKAIFNALLVGASGASGVNTVEYLDPNVYFVIYNNKARMSLLKALDPVTSHGRNFTFGYNDPEEPEEKFWTFCICYNQELDQVKVVRQQRCSSCFSQFIDLTP